MTTMSHPSRVRGLKYLVSSTTLAPSVLVAPFTGAWIEISSSNSYNKFLKVAPFTGAWIEIKLRGRIIEKFGSRTLHGCVD